MSEIPKMKKGEMSQVTNVQSVLLLAGETTQTNVTHSTSNQEKGDDLGK